MTAEVLKGIAETDNLSDALRVVSENPSLRQGVINIASGAVKGVVAFVNGRVTGAEVKGSTERGQRALTKLLSLDAAICKYAEFDDLLLGGDNEISVDIQQLLLKAESQSETQGMTVANIQKVAEQAQAKAAEAEAKPVEAAFGAGDERDDTEILEDEYTSVTIDIPMSSGQRNQLADLYEAAMAEEAERSAQVLAQANLLDSMQKAVGAKVESTEAKVDDTKTAEMKVDAMADEIKKAADALSNGEANNATASNSSETAAHEAVLNDFSDKVQDSDVSLPPALESSTALEAASAVESKTGADEPMDLTASLFDEVSEIDQITPAAPIPVFPMDQVEGKLDFGAVSSPGPAAIVEPPPYVPPAVEESIEVEPPVQELAPVSAEVSIEPTISVEPEASVEPPPLLDLSKTFDASIPEADTVASSAGGIGEPPPDTVSVDPPVTGGIYGADVEDKRFDSMIKEWEREEEKADFMASNPELNEDVPALTPEQKMLLEEMRKIHDPEMFNEADPTLQVQQEAELAMSEAQVELLLRAKLDEKPFETDSIDPELAAAENVELAQSKRNELEFFTQTNKEEFNAVDGRIAEDGSVISEEERFLLENHPMVPTEQAREEFLKSDPSLKDLDRPIMRDFTVAPEFDKSALDAIPDVAPPPKPTDEDYVPLVAMQEDKESAAKKPEGLIGRMRGIVTGKIAIYEGERIRDTFAPEKLIGPGLLVIICVALFTVPGWLKSSATGRTNEELAQQQMRLAIEEDISSQTPYATHERSRSSGPAPSPGRSGPFLGAGGGGGAPAAETGNISSSDFARAQRLQSEGKFTQAAAIYEEYMGVLGKSIRFRLTLIRLYMDAKQYDKAKNMCLAALKLNVTPEERAEIWQILGPMM